MCKKHTRLNSSNVLCLTPDPENSPYCDTAGINLPWAEHYQPSERASPTLTGSITNTEQSITNPWTGALILKRNHHFAAVLHAEELHFAAVLHSYVTPPPYFYFFQF